ncbi:MAG: hypothetical protein A3B30_01730 [Candidatus Komeilibacteria bacterium RIFCSPLOWO2_01_FULL_52_15]|uniref:Ribonuclease n=2 Tax=Candidatus Komeiliibacteriota TaxID=1817908 RepID=A0A1G2BRZ7_9BACT|nr:MAG: hypothetical protein A2677_03220 [Candidatus Komeilibacteria bacterium RIFCSPHIGHO2_01_FULL_52_14]OGY91955.1 MAG: hypothetical protein A3B30_01730 [Candidatus Komeilibacteria bacterium RIFCSPLOWO2_01_FULL_52_15]
MHRKIVGVDEVGRGSLAGPVVAAAVRIRDQRRFPCDEVRDSKELTNAQRRRILVRIKSSCSIRYGIVSHRLIDGLGIQAANVLAVDLALQPFCTDTHVLHADFIASFDKLTSLSKAVALHVFGESVIPEIAAASIAAKVFRDDIMLNLDRQYPVYRFAQHKGYATEQHVGALRRFGRSSVHRRSFGF